MSLQTHYKKTERNLCFILTDKCVWLMATRGEKFSNGADQ